MKHLIFLLAGLAASVSAPARAEPREFLIDEAHFSVGFLINHIGYADQLGQFLDGSGRFVWDESTNELHSGEVVVKASSVFTNHRDRDRHLRSEDFLHASEFEEIRFTAQRWVPEGDNRGILHGSLAMLGQSHPVALEVTINRRADYPFGHEQYTVGMSARTTLKRSQWGMTYALEDGLVGDEVRMLLEFEAIGQ
jgi:polyisoprenoid-binding protein YceI